MRFMINYKDSTHEYYDQKDRYTSVTTVLKGLSNTDFNIPAFYTAKSLGITVEEVKAMWQRKAYAGTLLHEFFERIEVPDLIRGTEDIISSIPLDNLLGVYVEFIIHNKEYLVAGQLDRLEVYPDKTFTIRDYKTDRYISFDGSYMSGKGQIVKKKNKYNFPCNHLYDCNGNKHTLQLSIYAYLLELQGYKLREGGLELWCFELEMREGEVVYEGKYPKIVGEVRKINLPYLKDEAKQILKYHKINI
jgi:hypothetical protein